MKTKLILLSFFISIFSISGFSQVIIMPVYQADEVFNIDLLFKFNLTNGSPGAVNGVVAITVEDAAANTVLQITSHPIALQPKASIRETQIHWQGGLQLGAGAYGRTLQQTGQLPYGDYVFCYHFIDVNTQEQLAGNCQEKSLKVFSQPELISPYNGETLANRFPLLTWRSPLPLTDQVLQYQLLIVPIQENQSPFEAINSNVPVVSLSDLQRSNIRYPSGGLPLEIGQHYAWQVSALMNGQEIGQTDIWTFTLADQKQLVINETPAPSNESLNFASYPYATAQLKGASHQMRGKIRFAFDNRRNAKTLEYLIQRSGQFPIVKLPKIALEPGVNKIDLDAAQINGLQDGQIYTLTIFGKNKHYLKFEYYEQ